MSIDGTWKVVTKSPMGDQKSTLTLKSEGSSITGTMSAGGKQSDIENGKIDGDKVSWSAKLSVPMPVTLEFDGVVSGDSVSGNVKVGSFGKAPFSGVRG